MYFRRRVRESNPITVEELVAIGQKAHGRTVWLKTPEGPVKWVFDFPTKALMPEESFVAIQNSRAEERRHHLQSRRPKESRQLDRYFFA